MEEEGKRIWRGNSMTDLAMKIIVNETVRSVERSGKRIRRRGSLANLPMDVIVNEILGRLPVKSLLRFKSVCKLWYSIIKSPNFSSIHYRLQNQINRTRPLIYERLNMGWYSPVGPVVFNPAGKPKYTTLWSVVDLNHDQENSGGLCNSSFFSYFLGMNWRGVFLSPVNGFVLMVQFNWPVDDDHCIIDGCRMAMFNPATRQFRFLIDFNPNTLNEGLKQRCLFGFGICKYPSTSINHVYKVVWLNISPTQKDVAVAKVYTVGGGDGGWRTINSAMPVSYVRNYPYYRPHFSASMNGKCYWLSVDVASILVFDMDEEVFREMKSPVYGNPRLSLKLVTNVQLSDVHYGGEGEGDSLAMFIFRPECLDVLVMDKEEAWHWIHRIVTYIDRPIGDLLNPRTQLQFPMTDAIILRCGKHSIALYNTKTQVCERFVDESLKEEIRPHAYGYQGISIFNFKESLFSVDGGIQVSDRVLEDFCTF